MKKLLFLTLLVFLTASFISGQTNQLSTQAYKAAKEVSKPRSSAIFEQMTPSTDFAIASQRFPDFGNCVLQGADDFTVPSGNVWNIESIAVIGVYYGTLPADCFEITFYEDNGGLPGAVIYHATAQSFIRTGDVFEVNLDVPLVLSAGTYWFSAMTDMAFGSHYQWFWQPAAGPQAGYELVWQDPCNLTLSNMLTYTPRGPWDDFVNYDLCFAFYGSVIHEVPVSNRAIYLGILLMISFVVIRMRRMI